MAIYTIKFTPSNTLVSISGALINPQPSPLIPIPNTGYFKVLCSCIDDILLKLFRSLRLSRYAYSHYQEYYYRIQHSGLH